MRMEVGILTRVYGQVWDMELWMWQIRKAQPREIQVGHFGGPPQNSGLAEIQLGHFDPERVVRFSLTQIWSALNPGWPLWSISQDSASRLHHQKWISKSVNQNLVAISTEKLLATLVH